MKKQRQEALLEIIEATAIDTQEGLLDALKQRGYTATQATISRDMKELCLVKKLEQGKQRYGVSSFLEENSKNIALSQILQDRVISVVAAQNMVVVKTAPGFAMAVCTALDHMEIVGNVGTLAGDDTIFLAMTDKERAQAFTKELELLLEYFSGKEKNGNYVSGEKGIL